MLPVDVVARLAGLSQSAAYQVLARVRRAGLAEVRRVDLGYVVGNRPIGLWSVTSLGLELLGTNGLQPASGELLPFGAPESADWVGPRDTALPLLVAAYRMLADVVDEYRRTGAALGLAAWEFPWVRKLWSPSRGTWLRVRLPAAAVLVPQTGEPAPPSIAIPLLLVPDLGTAPTARYREALRRLLLLRAQFEDKQGGSMSRRPILVVTTLDPDGRGARAVEWRRLVGAYNDLDTEKAAPAPVFPWVQLVRLRTVAGSAAGGAARDARDAGWGLPQSEVGPLLRPRRRAEQVLELTGRHPFLSQDQLADLIGCTRARVNHIQRGLIERGWLRQVHPEEVPPETLGICTGEMHNLQFVEITRTGRHELADWLGLDVAAADRYHGIIGPGRGSRRRAWLLRTLAHTLGVNAVFVAFALAGHVARRLGGHDELIEWRGAAACERRRCKPDGYGCYRREERSFGFLLEYDRGTESSRKYRSKFNAYYNYRDSGDATRDYSGFPTLLFVTTDAGAEGRIAREAEVASCTRNSVPLRVLVTTTDRIVGHREGILGPIWIRPGGSGHRDYWLPGGPPRGLFGVGREMVHSPRLVWPTGRRVDARSSHLK